MSSHSTRRKQRQRLARLQKLSTVESRKGRAIQLLMGWRAEARRRARSLGAPAVWDLANNPSVLASANQVDPSGELLSDLHRVCAEAVAEVAGHHLVGGSRPLADRRRRVKAVKPAEGEAVARGEGR